MPTLPACSLLGPTILCPRLALRPFWTLLLLSCLGQGACASRGEQLLAQGRYQEVLEELRAVDPAAIWLRARALQALGQLEEARQELLIGLVKAPRSATGHLLLGRVELALGHRGSALRALERAHQLDRQSLTVRRLLAGLLLERAQLRSDPRARLLDLPAARADAARAGALDPARQGSSQALMKRLARGGVLARQVRQVRQHTLPAGRMQAAASQPPAGGTVAATQPGQWPISATQPARAEVPSPGRCPGPPAMDPLRRLPQAEACSQAGSDLLARLQREDLLLGCRGPQVALELLARGCLAPAKLLWEALRQEDPADPRWALELIRVLLAQTRTSPGAQRRARAPTPLRQQLVDFLYLSEDRALAYLTAADLYQQAGRPLRAAELALGALPFCRGQACYLAVLEWVQRGGQSPALVQLARLLLRRFPSWPTPLRARLEGLAKGSPATPQRPRP